jgi:hypothetical protein
MGTVAGLILAATGLLEPWGDTGLPDEAVARVGDTLILRDDYQRLLAGIESDTKEAVDDATRRHVLDRMIEEELLVQRATELGLAQYDRSVRAKLVSVLISSVTAESKESDPSSQTLREFFESETEWFVQPPRLRVRRIFFRVRGPEEVDAAERRALAARQRLLDGDAFFQVMKAAGDPEVFSVPDALLPPAKLVEYLGPRALREAMKLASGEVSQPIRSPSGVQLLWLVERQDAVVPRFESVAPQVRAEWIRRAGDRALRSYLDELRDRADITIRELSE